MKAANYPYILTEHHWLKFGVLSLLVHGAILVIAFPVSTPHERPAPPIEVVMIDERPLLPEAAPTGPKPKMESPRKAEQKPIAMAVPQPSAPTKSMEAPPEPQVSLVREEIVFKDAPGAVPMGEGVALQASHGTGTGVSDGLVHAGPSGTGKGSGTGEGGGGTGGLGQAEFGGLGGPRFLHRELPEYPRLARRRKKEGTVSLMVTIDAHGKLVNVDIVAASDPIFVGPSVEAVKKSTFVPARRNGVPIAVKAILPIRFALTDS